MRHGLSLLPYTTSFSHFASAPSTCLHLQWYCVTISLLVNHLSPPLGGRLLRAWLLGLFHDRLPGRSSSPADAQWGAERCPERRGVAPLDTCPQGAVWWWVQDHEGLTMPLHSGVLPVNPRSCWVLLLYLERIGGGSRGCMCLGVGGSETGKWKAILGFCQDSSGSWLDISLKAFLVWISGNNSEGHCTLPMLWNPWNPGVGLCFWQSNPQKPPEGIDKPRALRGSQASGCHGCWKSHSLWTYVLRFPGTWTGQDSLGWRLCFLSPFAGLEASPVMKQKQVKCAWWQPACQMILKTNWSKCWT